MNKLAEHRRSWQTFEKLDNRNSRGCLAVRSRNLTVSVVCPCCLCCPTFQMFAPISDALDYFLKRVALNPDAEYTHD
jgi:hypothetical protein